MSVQLTCAECAADFHHEGRGRRPSRCSACRPTKGTTPAVRKPPPPSAASTSAASDALAALTELTESLRLLNTEVHKAIQMLVWSTD